MTDQESLGRLYILDENNRILNSYCTVELPWRDNQRSVSCIPEGEYEIEFTYSPKFKTNLWEIKNVPNRSGIRIHAGNFTRQIEGCILPGMVFGDIDRDGIIDVVQSGTALSKIHYGLSKFKKTTIKIVNYVN